MLNLPRASQEASGASQKHNEAVMRNNDRLDIFTVVEQLHVEVQVGPEQERIVFHIEILRSDSSNAFSARIYRQDSFEIKVFGAYASGLPGGVAHHELLVADDFFSGWDFSANTADEVRESVIRGIRSTFQQTGESKS